MINSLYLISNASSDTYNNSLTKFTNTFDAPITLPPGKWQIGLDTIIINPVFCNIPLEMTQAHLKIIKRIKTHNKVVEEHLLDISLPVMEYTMKSLVTELTKHTYLAGIEHLVRFTITLPSNETVFKAFKEQTPNFESMTSRENIHEYALFQKKFYKHNSFFCIEILQDYICVAIHNTLLKTLGFEKVETYMTDYFCVRESTTCKLPIKMKSILPRYLHIELKDVDCNIENEYRHIISTHALDMVTPHTHYKHFEQAQYGFLTTSSIKEFKVRILDDKYEQLRIGIGQPSILKMHFQEYDENEGSFFLTIKSGKNKTNFSHILQPPLQLDDDYMCALTSITYPSRFHHFTLKESKFYIHCKGLDDTYNTIVKQFNPEKKKIASIYELINQINTDCYSNEVNEFGSDAIRGKLKNQLLSIAFQDNSVAGGSTKLHLRGIRNAIYEFPAEIGLLLGQNVENGRWQLTIKYGNEVNVAEEFIPATPNFNLLIPNNLFLYSNFTDLVYMGGQLTNLLHIIPIRSQHQTNYATEEVRHLNYIQVRHKNLQNLKFQILSADGEPIAFEREDDTVSLTLKFVRKVK